MLFLVDECVLRALVIEMRGRGHDVVSVRESYPGFDDEQILALATAQGRIVLTEDRNFGTLTVRMRQPAVGVVIAHLGRFPGSAAQIVASVAKTIDDLGADCIGNLTVIEPGRARQRRLT